MKEEVDTEAIAKILSDRLMRNLNEDGVMLVKFEKVKYGISINVIHGDLAIALDKIINTINKDD
jgi:hypothetical protein